MTTPRLLSERYELGDTLGYGGMSEVHGGRDVRLGREVAVKVLRADLARDPQFQHRFRREAQNAAALNHPAIVAVYDTGETNTEHGPLPYIVMEYVDGRTLRDIVKTEGPMSERRALETMADVCAALDFSHRNGIIHRDVKPANVMITTNGAVKVMDFGIARALADGQGVTQTAAVIGTAQYLSPEQARGEAVDARSDVYAAGCVLYELVTGDPPFTGDSPVAVAYQHVREDAPPPSRSNPDVSDALDAVVLKAMSKNPANRYQSAGEMRSDMVRLLHGQRPMAPMVMTDADRTSMLGQSGPTDLVPGRHRPMDDHDDDGGGRRGRKGIIALAVIAGLAALLTFLLIFTDVFNSGPPQVAVPDLTGRPVADAQDELIRLGLQNTVVEVPSTPEQQGRVLSSDPVAGDEVDEGTSVTLQVGAGPTVVPVPALEGQTLEEASATLEGVGLRLAAAPIEETVTDDAQVGQVLRSDPPGGTSVPEGSTVTVVVGVAPEQVQVPDVVGSSQEQATSNIEGAELVVRITETDSEEPQGTVLSQDPEGGTEVSAGSTVTLTVSRGNLLEMPDLVGLTRGQAQQELARIGFTGQVNLVAGQASEGSQINRVIAQDVPAGGGLRRDQTVTLTIGQSGGGGGTTEPTDDDDPGFPPIPGG